MEIESIEYKVHGTKDFLNEISKLSSNNEAVYVTDVKNSREKTVVYHIINTTLMASSKQVHIIGQIINIEETKNHLENRLNIELKI